MSELDVSVVVPTYNRRAVLARVLDALDHQTLDGERFEVIVVSDGSTDGTDALLRTWEAAGPRRVALREANAGPSVARNAGAAVASGRLLVFVDDDVVPSADLLVHHLAAHRRAGGDVAGFGPMLRPVDSRQSPWVRWEHAMLEKSYDALASGRWEPSPRLFYSGNASVPASVFAAVGGFDANRRRAEDTELAYRLDDAGVGFVFAPDAVGWHHAERSLRSWLAIPGAYGVHDVETVRDGHAWLLDALIDEFPGRNRVTRVLTRLTVGRPAAIESATTVLVALARLADRLGAERVGRGGFSLVHNLRYYDGLAGALGGRQVFLDAFVAGARS
ncbi:MAG: glycosyltransferase family 2 protein [Acidimicrobiales bacterium]